MRIRDTLQRFLPDRRNPDTARTIQEVGIIMRKKGIEYPIRIIPAGLNGADDGCPVVYRGDLDLRFQWAKSVSPVGRVLVRPLLQDR